jgi:uncharacterized protein with FMN-binding domain
MKKVLFSGFVVFTFIGYSLHQRLDTENSQGAVPPVLPTPTSIPTQTTGRYRNGKYTGSVADAYYGNVQVKAIISNGKISDVQFLQYPNDRKTSVMINSQAMPYLTQEAIQAQSANVDGVSGATQTSRAFIESLQSALNQAM